MKISTTVTALVGAAAGLVVGFGAYEATAEPAGTSTSTASSSAGAVGSAGNAELAPCEPPSRLVAGVCVTDVERTVVVYDSPVTRGVGTGHDDNEYEHEDADEAEHEELEQEELEPAASYRAGQEDDQRAGEDGSHEVRDD